MKSSFKKKTFAGIGACVLAFSLTACGNGDVTACSGADKDSCLEKVATAPATPAFDVVGVWGFDAEATLDGMSEADYEKFLDGGTRDGAIAMMEIIGGDIVFEFSADNTVNLQWGDDKVSGTWEKVGDSTFKLTKENAQELVFNVIDDNLAMENGDNPAMYFAKQERLER